jgi:oligopeptide transport system permease protein
MLAYILRRLLIAIPTLLIIIVFSFVIITAAPGGPFTPEEGEQIDPEILANLRAAYNLDEPIYVQLWLYMGNLLQGDLGPSFVFRGRTVADIISTGFPVSLQLGLAAMAIGILFGVTFGVIAALRKNSAVDYGVMSVAMTGIAVPTFVVAPLLALVFGLYLKLLPISGWGGGAIANMVLPVTALALSEIGVLARVTRGAMVDVMRANYIRTARAKGLPERQVVWRHTLRAALLPIVSYVGPATAGILTGSVVIEQIFGLPGIGRAFVEGALNRDYPVVMGITILYATIIISLNLMTDIAYRFLDPRIRSD